MSIYWETTAVLSSFSLRLFAYLFLRWIPGHHFPPLIYLLGAVYFGSSAFCQISQPSGNAASKEDVKIQVLQYDEDHTPATDGDIIQSSILRLERQLTRIRSAWDQDPGFLRTLLLGVPNRPYSVWSLITVLINFILVVCTIDSVYHGPVRHQSAELSFARIGFVSDTTASILIREPDTSQLPIYISYRGNSNSAYTSADQSWKPVERIYWLSNETDFTYSTKINGLLPSSNYQYATSNNHTGFFTTAPSPGLINKRLGKFTFLTSSCLKARFPYNPFSHPLSVFGFRHLAKWIPDLRPSFMVFLGDFIYVDVPLRFGYDVENYRREYRSVYNSPDWPGVSKDLPWIHVMDDHDIANDWDANTTEPYPTALDAWNLYHSSVNPPPARPSASYFTFTHGPASFFLLDTRRYRTPESPLPPDSPEKSMLGPEQLASFFSFLRRRDPPGVKWKIVISSVPFTRNWRFNYLDTWAGYLYERDRILTAMWDVGARGDGVGVVVLSGDRHEFAATAFPPPKEGKWPMSATVHEFSTSPLSMFYLPTKTYREVEGEDEVCMKYIPDGNSKFGAVEIEQMKNDEQSLLRYRLFVDGEEKWDHVILSPPAGVHAPRARDALW